VVPPLLRQAGWISALCSLTRGAKIQIPKSKFQWLCIALWDLALVIWKLKSLLEV